MKVEFELYKVSTLWKLLGILLRIFEELGFSDARFSGLLLYIYALMFSILCLAFMMAFGLYILHWVYPITMNMEFLAVYAKIIPINQNLWFALFLGWLFNEILFFIKKIIKKTIKLDITFKKLHNNHSIQAFAILLSNISNNC